MINPICPGTKGHPQMTLYPKREGVKDLVHEDNSNFGKQDSQPTKIWTRSTIISTQIKF